MSVNPIDARIFPLLNDYGRLDRRAEVLDDTDDLYQHGMSSHDSIQLMMALESEFDIEFPNEMLTRQTFQSVAAIRNALSGLGVTVA